MKVSEVPQDRGRITGQTQEICYAVEIVYLVEKKFGITIKDMKEARPALQSINTLAAFIEARTN